MEDTQQILFFCYLKGTFKLHSRAEEVTAGMKPWLLCTALNRPGTVALGCDSSTWERERGR